MNHNRLLRLFGTLQLAVLGLTPTLVVAAKPVEVLEAAYADWPEGLGRDIYRTKGFRKGEVTVEFVAGPDGWVYVAGAPESGQTRKFGEKEQRSLEEDFDKVAAAAMLDWAFRVPADLCGVLRGRQVFTFDGGAEEPTDLGSTSAALADEAAGIDVVLAPITLGYTQTSAKLRDVRGTIMVMHYEYKAGPRLAIEPLPARTASPAGFVAPSKVDGSMAAFMAKHTQFPETERKTKRSSSLLGGNRPQAAEPGDLVIATFTITPEGTAVDVAAHAAFGDKEFHAEALDALRGARFEPAQRDARPASVRACQSISRVRHVAR
jgi:hypothetical protein